MNEQKPERPLDGLFRNWERSKGKPKTETERIEQGIRNNINLLRSRRMYGDSVGFSPDGRFSIGSGSVSMELPIPLDPDGAELCSNAQLYFLGDTASSATIRTLKKAGDETASSAVAYSISEQNITLTDFHPKESSREKRLKDLLLVTSVMLSTIENGVIET